MTTTTDEFELFLNGELSLAQISERHAQQDEPVNYEFSIEELMTSVDKTLAESEKALKKSKSERRKVQSAIAQIKRDTANFEKKSAKKYADTPVGTSSQLETDSQKEK
jgi:hypothetical protein